MNNLLGQEKQRFYGTYSLPLGGWLGMFFSLFWCFVLSLILWCKASVSHLLDNYWSLNCCCCTSHWQPWQKPHPCFKHQSNTRALSFFYYDLCLFFGFDDICDCSSYSHPWLLPWEHGWQHVSFFAYLVSWHLRTWVHLLARHEICTNNYILLQFPKETNTRGSKTLTPFTHFHTNSQRFD